MDNNNYSTRGGQVMPDSYRRTPLFCGPVTPAQAAPTVTGSLPQLAVRPQAAAKLLALPQYKAEATFVLIARALQHARKTGTGKLFTADDRKMGRALAIAILEGVVR
jgi:hypothetical protein